MLEHKRIAVTGASGFVGQHLVAKLVKCGARVSIVSRNHNDDMRLKKLFEKCDVTSLNNIDAGNGTIIHAAGLAHVFTPKFDDQSIFEEANTKFTSQVVDEALLKSIRNIIHLSSIFAVSGHSSSIPLNDQTEPAPTSLYGISKRGAEQQIERFAQMGNFGISLRPPLIIGFNAPGNWRKLQDLASKNVLLPFGAIPNARSFLSVDTLTDFILHIIQTDWPKEKSGNYCLAEKRAVSLTEVCSALRVGMNKPRKLLPVPHHFLSVLGALLGKKQMMASLIGDLVVDPSRAFDTFNFEPKSDILAEIEESGRRFIQSNRR